MARRQRALPDLSRSGGFIGVGALACVLFVDFASVPVLGWWSVAGLVLLWLVLLLLAVRLFTPHPRWVLVLPVVGFLVWLLLVVAANSR